MPIREPISHIISRYLQNNEYYGKEFKKNTNWLEFMTATSNDTLLEHFLNNNLGNRLLPETWFETMVCPQTSISKEHIFKNFNVADGFTHYKKNNIRLLVYRYDIDNTLKEMAIKKLLLKASFTDFTICKHHNTSSKKPYNDIYRRLNEEIKLPQKLIKQKTDNDYFRTFFTKKQQSDILNKWSAK